MQISWCRSLGRFDFNSIDGIVRFKDQIDFVSTGTFIIVELICFNHAKFSALFKLRQNEIFKELSGADTGMQAVDNTVVGKIRFCSLDIAFRGTELVTVELKGQLSLLQGVKIFFGGGVADARLPGEIGNFQMRTQ